MRPNHQNQNDLVLSQNFCELIRRMRYYDRELQKQNFYLTNYFECKALKIVIIYLNRWKVEPFLKWLINI